MFKKTLLTILLIFSTNVFPQSATFDVDTGILIIPEIRVTPTEETFTAVLKRTHQENFTFRLTLIEKTQPTERPTGYYNVSTRQLSVPLVIVGTDMYQAELQAVESLFVPLYYTLTIAKKITETKQVIAVRETEPVPVSGDAADDPAIWVHPTDASQSTLITTQKQGALIVYDLQGNEIQYLPDGNMNNVDLRDNFELGQKTITLVAASNRSNNSIALYTVNVATRHLEHVAARTITTSLLEVYGLCMYHSEKDRHYYVFVNDKTGQIEQWELFAREEKVDAKLVRILRVNSQVEGCVADDLLGQLYIGEELVGIWKFSAESDGGQTGKLINTTDNTHLSSEMEGLTIYYAGETDGYLIASSQGEHSFIVYERSGNNTFLGKFQIITNTDKGIDAVDDTDGIDVTHKPLGSAFPFGVFVAQDGVNFNFTKNQNFKLVPWEYIVKALDLH